MECQLDLLSSILNKSNTSLQNGGKSLKPVAKCDNKDQKKIKDSVPTPEENSLSKDSITLKQENLGFSLLKSGLHADAEKQERQPLLLADICSLLSGIVLGQERNIDDKRWYKLKKNSVSKVVLVIAEGLSVHHFCHLRCTQDLSCNGKKPSKRRKLDSGCECVEGCSAPCTEPLSERLLAALPRLSALQAATVETVPPALYGRDILQELFQLRCSEKLIKDLVSDRTAAVPASLSKDFPSLVLYKSIPGVQLLHSQQPETLQSNISPMEEFWLAKQNVKLNYYKTLEYNFCSRFPPTSGKFWGKGKSANSLPPDKFDRRLLLLSLREMLQQQYPMPQALHDQYSKPRTDASSPLSTDFSNFIPTKDIYAPVTASSPIFGIDCEFNMRKKPVLIAVVNESGELIYRTPILWEGGDGDDRGQTLQEVQSVLRERLPPDAILVGHSFNIDLRALQLFHPYVIDSFYLFDVGTDFTLSRSLRHLARLFLQREVQLCKHEYHEPAEDALTSVQLLQLKLSKGVTYGVKKLGGFVPSISVDFMESSDDQCFFQNFFEALRKKSSSDRLEPAQVVITSSVQQAWHAQLGQFSSAAVVQEKSSEAVVLRSLAELGASESPLVVAHFVCTSVLEPKKTRKKALKKFDQRVSDVFENLPPGTLFCLLIPGVASEGSIASSHNGLLLVGTTKPSTHSQG